MNEIMVAQAQVKSPSTRAPQIRMTVDRQAEMDRIRAEKQTEMDRIRAEKEARLQEALAKKAERDEQRKTISSNPHTGQRTVIRAGVPGKFVGAVTRQHRPPAAHQALVDAGVLPPLGQVAVAVPSHAQQPTRQAPRQMMPPARPNGQNPSGNSRIIPSPLVGQTPAPKAPALALGDDSEDLGL